MTDALASYHTVNPDQAAELAAAGGPRVFATIGLPASGKSTWARELVASHPTRIKRVNKDDLRNMLDGGRRHKRNERFVVNARDMLVSQALEDGLVVIVDDTNLNPIHAARLSELAAKYDATFTLVEFRHIPLRVCIDRDKQRSGDAHVGARNIARMARRWNVGPSPAPWRDGLPTAIVVDLDGTLAELGDRDVYDAANCHVDTPNPAVVAIIEGIRATRPDTTVIACTGRSDKDRPPTEQWLDTHTPDLVDQVLMRSDGDRRPDTEVKAELYRTHIEPSYNVLFVLDDREGVVGMWRDLGLRCHQVAEAH